MKKMILLSVLALILFYQIKVAPIRTNAFFLTEKQNKLCQELASKTVRFTQRNVFTQKSREIRAALADLPENEGGQIEGNARALEIMVISRDRVRFLKAFKEIIKQNPVRIVSLKIQPFKNQEKINIKLVNT